MVKRYTDQVAAHALMLACRRLDPAIKSRDLKRGETARADVVAKMADLAEEFGLLDAAEALREELPEFDGRHIEMTFDEACDKVGLYDQQTGGVPALRRDLDGDRFLLICGTDPMNPPKDIDQTVHVSTYANEEQYFDGDHESTEEMPFMVLLERLEKMNQPVEPA